jgi:hypothetical protein
MTKNRTIVFAFAALLMAMPFATGNVYATTHQNDTLEGTANLKGFCGIAVPPTIVFGDIAPGVISEEFEASIYTGDSSLSGIEISATASDWTGTDVVTFAELIHDGTAEIPEGFEIVITDGVNTERFIAKDDPTSSTNGFDISGDAERDFTNLKDILDESSLIVIVDSNDPVPTKIVMEPYILGDYEKISITPSDTSLVVAKQFSLDGSIPAVHLKASVTKFVVDITDYVNTDLTYAEKTSMSTSSVILTSEATPKSDTVLVLQISTIGTLENMPYTGILTQTLTFTALCEQ